MLKRELRSLLNNGDKKKVNQMPKIINLTGGIMQLPIFAKVLLLSTTGDGNETNKQGEL
jgi:hypothetical protein